MMKCEELTRLASEGMDRPLGLRERVAMKFHLLRCDGCSHFTRQMKALRGISRAYVSMIDDAPDPENDKL